MKSLAHAVALCFVLVGVFAPILANDLPVIASVGGKLSFPALSTYVSDEESGALAYIVTSGGGSIAAATYTHTFDTLGTYTVKFTVFDFEGKDTLGSFQVTVT